MKRSGILLLLLFFMVNLAQALEPEVFKELSLSAPAIKFQNAGYRSVRIIDERTDTMRYGKVKLGLMNRPATVIFKPSLAEQLTAFIPKRIDSTNTRELVILIKKLEFMERSIGFLEEGQMVFDAELYEYDGQHYYFIQPIVKGIKVVQEDVTQSLLQQSCEYLTSLLPEYVNKSGNHDKPLSYIELVKADSLAKRTIKVYNTESFPDGVYITYNAFKELKPDYQVKVVGKRMKIKSVTVTGKDGMPKEVFRDKVYVLVTDGIPFIATLKGYYPLRFRNDDFTFVGKVHQEATASQIVNAGVMFGLLGILVVQGGENTFYLTKINYKDGSFIYLKEIPFGEEDGPSDF
jgi:hypothetical protein